MIRIFIIALEVENDVFADAANREDAGVFESGGDFRRGGLEDLGLFAEPDGFYYVACYALGEAAGDGFDFREFGHLCS